MHDTVPVEVIYGIHAVSEVLRSRGRAFEYVAVACERHDARVQRIARRELPRSDANHSVHLDSSQDGGRQHS